MSQTFVINEAIHACCGSPVANGTCSCKTGQTKQRTNNGGLPSNEAAWEAIFNDDAAKRKEQPTQQQTVNAHDGGHTPLGIPKWNW